MDALDRLRLEERCTNLAVLDVAQDLFGDRLSKQTQGSNYSMLCPTLHEEKTPSFWVKPGKNLWICYGCAQFGGPFMLPFAVVKGFVPSIPLPFDEFRYLRHKLGLEKDNPEHMQTYARFLSDELLRRCGDSSIIRSDRYRLFQP